MKRKTTLIIALALLFVPFVQVKAQIPPLSSGLDYWPQTTGITIQYNYKYTTGTYNATTGAVNPGTDPQVYQFNLETIFSPYPNSFAVTTYIEGHTDPTGTQMNGFGFSGGNCFFGEAENQGGNVIYPPEPKIACIPAAGQIFNVYSTVMQSETNHTVLTSSFHTKYRTLRHTSLNAAWPDVWVTSLAEINPDGSPSWVANYYFANGIGMVMIYYGYVDTTDHTTISEMRIMYKNP